MKRLIGLFLIAAMLMLSGCGGKDYSTGLHHAELQIENYGTITMELDADTAPITVANFCKLANDGFYDGLTFHRIIDGFMIQIPRATAPAAPTRTSRANFPRTA